MPVDVWADDLEAVEGEGPALCVDIFDPAPGRAECDQRDRRSIWQHG
jgi:hypothetical protein